MSRRAFSGVLGVSGMVCVWLAVPSAVVAQRSLTVSTDGAIRTLTDAIRQADSGSRITVRAGTYQEPMIIVNKPVTIVGEGYPVLDGEGTHQIMAITANEVTVRGIQFRDVGTSYTDDRAAIKVASAHDCVIEDNRIDDGFFGIYLAGVSNCVVRRNVIRAHGRSEAGSGNGIHLWSSHHITIANNAISGHRDGIYFEFVHDSDIQNNLSEGNLRYGLHFMYSDDCRYVANTFRRNGAGVAVMFTKRVQMIGNRFEDNWGSSAYGLLLKEIYDSRIEGNRFSHNTVGLVADGATRMVATHNAFAANGWAIRLDASSDSVKLEANDFLGNTFDVATNSSSSNALLRGNYFDEYNGYDLNHDGFGDVPHHPVRLFSILVAHNEPTLILLHSLFAAVLDAAERVIPMLTPATLVDEHPSMRKVA